MHALESSKNLGMTERARIDYLETLGEMVEKFEGAERDRIKQEIMLLRGWDCASM